MINYRYKSQYVGGNVLLDGGLYSSLFIYTVYSLYYYPALLKTQVTDF